MTCSLHCYHRKVLIIDLIKSCMLVSNIPRRPVSNFLPIQLLHILLSITEGDHIVPISTEQPHPYPSIQKNPPILVNRPSLRNRVVESSTDRPSFIDMIHMESNFICIPILDASTIRWTVWYLSD